MGIIAEAQMAMKEEADAKAQAQGQAMEDEDAADIDAGMQDESLPMGMIGSPEESIGVET